MSFRIFNAVFYVFWGIVFVEAMSNRHEFQANTNFDNEARWPNGFPCSGDKVEFDPYKVVSIFVQTNTSITEMVFPMDGEFIFADNVVWGTNDNLALCQNNNNHQNVLAFTSDADDWFNKDNWKAFDTSQNVIKVKDLLDVEQVPCEHDQALFTSTSSYTVAVDFDLTLETLNIWDKTYDTDTFASYRTSERGRYNFQGNGAVTAEGKSCLDKTGCACRTSTNTVEIQNKICSHITCGSPACEDMLQPIGQCCSTCGALLTFPYESTYSELSMLEFLRNTLAKEKYLGAHAVLSKISSAMISNSEQSLQYGEGLASNVPYDYIQVMITDENTGSKVGSTAKIFAKDIVNILSSGSNDLGVKNITTQISGNGIQSQNNLSTGAIAGIVIGVLAIVGVSVIAALYLTKNGFAWKSFAPLIKLKEPKESLDNPLYDMSDTYNAMTNKNEEKETNSKSTGLPNIDAVTSDFGFTFGNPLYNEEDV